MLQAFVDDSGSATGDKRLFLAGYIHRIDHWVEFSNDWIVALQEPPALKSLHMTKAFRGWSNEARQQKLRRLASVIARYEPISIECSMSTSEFKELLQPHAPYDLRHPYSYCFHSLVISAARLIESYGLEGPLDFVFDNQGNVGRDAACWYPIFKQLQGPAVCKVLGETPTFQNDEDVMPLQAADMLAWHCRVLREPTCTSQDREIAKLITLNHACVEVTRELIEKWAEGFSKTPGIDAAKWKTGSARLATVDIIREVPPERLIPVMEAIQRHGNRMRRLKLFLARIGLRKIWKWMSKRKSTFH